MSRHEWWRGGVIYQIYPRSFCDTSGDGVGDLAGITSRLEYVAALGVDAVWISPFLQSPQKDYGYDVSSYRDVDPLFGTNDDFAALLRKARDLGLRVIMDHVLSHTSDQHPWFVSSRKGRDADKADWYVWAEPRPDGTPPNNWLSVFGGSAWQWESRRRQYYLHNFLIEQPDLNYHNPEVVAQVLDDMEFWLRAGVAGFRLDAVNFCVHDAALRDNPPWPAGKPRSNCVPESNPYGLQSHIYDKTRPEMIDVVRRIREVMDRYPGAVTIGELCSDESLAVMAAYTSGGDKLHMAYTFELLTSEFSARHIRDVIGRLEAEVGDGWPCWSLGNHDVVRVLTRWGGKNAPLSLAKILAALLVSLRGSVCIYQGEELGLAEAVIPRERIRDPYGLAFWPEFIGRDGCRTPMPWSHDAPNAGFSTSEPWLPVPEEHRAMAVSLQEHDPGSVLAAYRALLRWRRSITPLRIGSIELVDTPEPVLALVRAHERERVMAVFNLGASAVSVRIPGIAGMERIDGHGLAEGRAAGAELSLPAHGVYFARSMT